MSSMTLPLVIKMTLSMSCLFISRWTRFRAASRETLTSEQFRTTMDGLTGPPSTFSNCLAAFLMLRSMNLMPFVPVASLVGLFGCVQERAKRAWGKRDWLRDGSHKKKAAAPGCDAAALLWRETFGEASGAPLTEAPQARRLVAAPRRRDAPDCACPTARRRTRSAGPSWLSG